jgi:hypothetical protein
MSELMEQHFLGLTIVMACFWAFGFVSGKWWESLKWKEPPPENDEIWW